MVLGGFDHDGLTVSVTFFNFGGGFSLETLLQQNRKLMRFRNSAIILTGGIFDSTMNVKLPFLKSDFSDVIGKSVDDYLKNIPTRSRKPPPFQKLHTHIYS